MASAADSTLAAAAVVDDDDDDVDAGRSSTAAADRVVVDTAAARIWSIAAVVVADSRTPAGCCSSCSLESPEHCSMAGHKWCRTVTSCFRRRSAVADSSDSERRAALAAAAVDSRAVQALAERSATTGTERTLWTAGALLERREPANTVALGRTGPRARTNSRALPVSPRWAVAARTVCIGLGEAPAIPLLTAVVARKMSADTGSTLTELEALACNSPLLLLSCWATDKRFESDKCTVSSVCRPPWTDRGSSWLAALPCSAAERTSSEIWPLLCELCSDCT